MAFTNAELRAAVEEYFQDKAACERRHGKIGSWNVKYVTDMSSLFDGRTDFNEACTGVPSSRRASRSIDSTPRVSSTHGRRHISEYGFVGHRRMGHVIGDDI